MKLFNFLKPKEQNSLDSKISSILKQLFPNGQKDIDERTNALLHILNNKVDAQTATTILIRSSSLCYTTNLRNAFNIERLRQHLAGYCLHYFSDKALQEFYILLVNTILKPKELDWVSMMPSNLAQVILEGIKSNPQATSFDEIYGAVGEFGLAPSNPVPVYGVPANDVYLGRLRTLDGMPIKWERIGSMQYHSIYKLIDNYNIFNSKGNKIANIYISPYHWHTSLKAPKGFTIII